MTSQGDLPLGRRSADSRSGSEGSGDSPHPRPSSQLSSFSSGSGAFSSSDGSASANTSQNVKKEFRALGVPFAIYKMELTNNNSHSSEPEEWNFLEFSFSVHCKVD